MENFILRSNGVHLVSNKVQPLVLERRSNKCSNVRSLVGCGQQRNVEYSCNVISNSLLLKNITNRIYNSSKHCTSNPTQHAIFSSKPPIRKQSRIVKMELASATSNDSKASFSSKTDRNLGWNLFDNLSNVPVSPSYDSQFELTGGYLLGRTIALLLVFTLSVSMAARQGAISMAAHQICVQIWLAVSLLLDSLALAGQFVVLTQPINALAFVFDGLHYGVSI